LDRHDGSTGAGAVKFAKLRPKSENERKKSPRGSRALSKFAKTAKETNKMKTADSTLHQVSDLVQIEIDKYLTEDFVIDEVTSEFLENIESEWYIRTTVIFQDGHPRPDPRVLNRFSIDIEPLCAERGLLRPTVVYANRSEIPA